MGDYTKDAPSFAAVVTAEEFKAATAKTAIAAPTEAKGTLTKAKALALVEYFSHIGDNPCASKYAGVNVDIAADKVGIPRSMAQALYGEWQAGVAAVAESVKDAGVEEVIK